MADISGSVFDLWFLGLAGALALVIVGIRFWRRTRPGDPWRTFRGREW